MKDIFGQYVNVGDRVAVGMAYNRSSVLRCGEVVSIKETPTYVNRMGEQQFKYSVRVRWTHDGGSPGKYGRAVKDSTILYESSHRFAKLMVLPKGFAEQFPSDIE